MFYESSCDFSDTDSVVDSIIDHLRSPNPYVDNNSAWSPVSSYGNLTDSGSPDHYDFADMLTDAITNDQMGYIGYEPPFQSNVASNLSDMVNYRPELNRQANMPTQAYSSNTLNGVYYHNDLRGEMENYLGNMAATLNPLNNVDDLRSLSVEELLPSSPNSNTTEFGIPFYSSQQQQLNLPASFSPQNDSDIFTLNRSTMDNRRQKHFLQMIQQHQQQQQHKQYQQQSQRNHVQHQQQQQQKHLKQQQQQQQQQILQQQQEHQQEQQQQQQQEQQQPQPLEFTSISPPPSPSSEWSDIPSPVSSTVSESEIQPKKQTKKVENKKPSLNQTRKRTTRKPYSTNTGKPRLFQFLQDILNDPENYPCIEWVDKTSGTFKFLNSTEVARLWGFRKNKPAMKYEHFARSLRTYVAKGILKKPRNKLVYGFALPDNE